VNGFLRELTQEIKTSEGLYQAYAFADEVQNASLGRLALLFLGLDIKENTSYAEPLIRFEAGRQLLLNLKSLSLIERFYEINEAIQHGVFQVAFERFFNSMEGEILVDVGEGRKIRVKYRQGGIIYDKKPTKSFTSYLRKNFEEKFEEIVDFYNINIVVPSNDGIADPVDYIKNLILSITNFIGHELGQQVKVSNINWYGTLNYQDDKLIIVDGKRKGSEGNRLVRGKVIMKFGNEVVELVVYPYFSLKDNEKGYWGWIEKIEDDIHYAERRLLAGENGLPSFYDLLFPPVFYPRHYEHKLRSDYHK